VAAPVGFSTSATAWRMPSISERAAALRAAFRDAAGDEDQPLVGCELALDRRKGSLVVADPERRVTRPPRVR
jgi:hypothetical protein